MSDTGSEFLSEIARKVAASDAKAAADFADIMAGRPYKRTTKPKTTEEATAAAAAPRKPRAKRTPKPKVSPSA